jgi:hypothetical protein
VRFTKKDSTGQFDTQPYGAAVWNGTKWTLMKVPYHDYGTTNTYPGPLRSVYGFSPNEVYVTSYANLLRWNGTNWQEKAFFMTGVPFAGQVNKTWGTSGSNLYCVGNSGAVYHFNGSTWQKIESGSDQNINDVWGVNGRVGSEPFILAGASNIVNTGNVKLLQIKTEGYIDSIPWPNNNRRIGSVWFQSPYRLFTAGGGVFTRLTNQHWKEFTELPFVYSSRIRGQRINDIFVVGHFSLLSHYNGANWHVYSEVAVANPYYSCDYKQNNFVAVGLNNNRPIVLRIRRNY